MLIESIVRSISSIIGQYLLVETALKSLFDDLSDFDNDDDSTDWPYLNPVNLDDTALARNQIQNQLQTLLDLVLWAEDDRPDTRTAYPAPSIQAEIARLRRGRVALETQLNRPADVLRQTIIEFRDGILIDSWTYLDRGVRTMFERNPDDATAAAPGVPGTPGTGGIPGTPTIPPVPAGGGFWVLDDDATTPNPSEDLRLSVRLVRERIEDARRLLRREIDTTAVILSELGPTFGLLGIRSGVDNLGAYPILTSDARQGYSSPAGDGRSSTASMGTNSLQRIVDSTMRSVLGRTPRPKDHRSFLAALNQSFEFATVNGVTTVTYQPRSFAGQTELGGGVTGAQASLYSRASLSLEKALPLLEALTPLRPAADQEETEAVRAIVRTELTQIVMELKTEGGPNTARTDQLFINLFGHDPATPIPANFDLHGHLEDLEEEFGFGDERLINTLDEESVFSNFLAVIDYSKQILVGWQDFRSQAFGRDLGTRLVLLSRALSVTAESVEEVYAAMNSVYVGPAERQVARFFDDDLNRPILVSELLSWVSHFATEEAPKLVQEGGRRGVEAIQPTAVQLERLIRSFIDALSTDPGLPRGMDHPRVRFPLQELRGYLDQVQQLAEEVRRPLRQALS